MKNVKMLIDQIRKWDESFSGRKTRDNFLKSEFGEFFGRKKDIDDSGGWSTLYPLATGKKPPKLGNKSITLELMFNEYSRLQHDTGIFDRALNFKEIEAQKPKISAARFKNEFPGGLTTFYREHRKRIAGLYKNIPSFIFVGKAAEYLANAELLFRGYTAQSISVDEGLDILAYKNFQFYFFQVKHGKYNRQLGLERISITKSSFENNIMSNVYYMLILSTDRRRDFLIIPVFVIEKLGNKNLDKIQCIVLHKGKDVYINKISLENKVTKYLNNNGWKILQYS
jgi:hypothetical protein